MSNPMLREDKFGFRSGPPVATQPGWGVPAPAPGTPGGPPVPPSGDPVSPWPPSDPVAGTTLTKRGVSSATGVLLALLLVTSVVGWNLVTVTTVGEGPTATTTVDFPGWIFGAMLVAFGVAIATFFKPTIARFTAPLYAALQGLVVGSISAVYSAEFDGIVLQAVGLTIGVFAVMLVLYATGRIRVTPRFRLMVVAATGGVMLIYLATIVMHLFGGSMPFIHDTGAMGIGFSAVVVGIAAMNLALDFDFVDRAEAGGAPKHMEWFAALSLLITLVWLYLEILRLLAKLRSR